MARFGVTCLQDCVDDFLKLRMVGDGGEQRSDASACGDDLLPPLDVRRRVTRRYRWVERRRGGFLGFTCLWVLGRWPFLLPRAAIPQVVEFAVDVAFEGGKQLAPRGIPGPITGEDLYDDIRDDVFRGLAQPERDVSSPFLPCADASLPGCVADEDAAQVVPVLRVKLLE